MIFLKIWAVRGRFDWKIILEATEPRPCAKRAAILFCAWSNAENVFLFIADKQGPVPNQSRARSITPKNRFTAFRKLVMIYRFFKNDKFPKIVQHGKDWL